MADKNINIGVGADVSGLKTGMNDAAKLVQDAGTKMQTAAKDATQKTEQSFSNLRQAYRATARDAYEIALQQGTQSAAFREAINTAGSYKDELDQVNNSISVLSSDTPILTGALGLGQGLAGAFSAAQGAMALFGSESEDVQKALLKVQGAMALTQGLQAVGQLGDAFSSFADVLDVKVLPALRSIGLLIAANPIAVVGAAVVGLSVAYAALADNTDRAAVAQRSYVAVNFNASASILEQTEKIKQQNKELLIQANAKQKGIEVDAERANVAAKENKELEDKLKLLNENVKYQDSSTQSGLLNNINIKNQVLELQNQINANKDLIDAYKEKIRLEGIINQKDPKGKGGAVAPKSNFGDLKNVIKFNPVVEFDPTVIDDISDLILDSSEQLAESLDGMFSPLDQNLTNMELKLSEFKDKVGEILIEGLGNAFAEFGRIAGANLAGANESVGAAAEAMIGSLAATIGSGMIALGVPMLFAVATAGEGAALIAGGVALNVLAGALGESSKGGGGTRSQPSNPDNSTSNRNVFSGFTPQNNSMVLTTRLIGQDLLMSVQKAGQQNTRVR
jgi:hypothetical protein